MPDLEVLLGQDLSTIPSSSLVLAPQQETDYFDFEHNDSGVLICNL